MTLRVTRRGRAALRTALRRSAGGTVRGTTRVAYQPTGGRYRIETGAITGLR